MLSLTNIAAHAAKNNGLPVWGKVVLAVIAAGTVVAVAGAGATAYGMKRLFDAVEAEGGDFHDLEDKIHNVTHKKHKEAV